MTRRARQVVLAVASIALAAGIVRDDAQARDLPIVGGPGGGAHRLDCGSNICADFD